MHLSNTFWAMTALALSAGAGWRFASPAAAPSRFDYELRRLAAPDGSDEAQAMADALGDRISLQAGVVF